MLIVFRDWSTICTKSYSYQKYILFLLSTKQKYSNKFTEYQIGTCQVTNAMIIIINYHNLVLGSDEQHNSHLVTYLLLFEALQNTIPKFLARREPRSSTNGSFTAHHLCQYFAGFYWDSLDKWASARDSLADIRAAGSNGDKGTSPHHSFYDRFT